MRVTNFHTHKLKKAQHNKDTAIKTIHQFTTFETVKVIIDNPIKTSCILFTAHWAVTAFGERSDSDTAGSTD